MEKQKQQPNEPQSEVTGKQKKTYEPPKAEFVPLKLEERLLGCNKSWCGVLTQIIEPCFSVPNPAPTQYS